MLLNPKRSLDFLKLNVMIYQKHYPYKTEYFHSDLAMSPFLKNMLFTLFCK